ADGGQGGDVEGSRQGLQPPAIREEGHVPAKGQVARREREPPRAAERHGDQGQDGGDEEEGAGDRHRVHRRLHGAGLAAGPEDPLEPGQTGGGYQAGDREHQGVGGAGGERVATGSTRGGPGARGQWSPPRTWASRSMAIRFPLPPRRSAGVMKTPTPTTKRRRAPAATPGRLRGRYTRQKAWAGEA